MSVSYVSCIRRGICGCRKCYVAPGGLILGSGLCTEFRVVQSLLTLLAAAGAFGAGRRRRRPGTPRPPRDVLQGNFVSRQGNPTRSHRETRRCRIGHHSPRAHRCPATSILIAVCTGFMIVEQLDNGRGVHVDRAHDLRQVTAGGGDLVQLILGAGNLGA